MSTIKSLFNGLIKASMFDNVVSLSRTTLENYNLLDNYENVFYYWWYPMVKEMFKHYLRLEIKGQEHTPPHGPLIVAANHGSFLDPIIISASVYRQIHWMSKKENFDFPIVKSIFKLWSAFPVDRGSGDKKAMGAALDHLANGRTVGIFPEGTRRHSADTHLMKLHNGAAKLAVMTGASILPVMTTGTFSMLKKGEFFPKPVKVKLFIGKPIHCDHLKGQEDDWPKVVAITNELEKRMLDLVKDEPLPGNGNGHGNGNGGSKTVHQEVSN
ncbi:MAG: lysophospholipid acyltransferase family protein [Candidatus Hodarchaeota archaeon]